MSADNHKDAYEGIKWNGWGQHDVGIKLDEERLVARHINGKDMHGLLDFIGNEILKKPGIPPLVKSPGLSTKEALERLNKPVVNQMFLDDLGQALKADQIRLDGFSRLSHVFGKNYRDLWRVRNGMIDRAPDGVLLPNCHDDCVKIVELANKHNVALVPFGGGTNVTGGVEPSPFETKRMIVSVDLRRMSRMLKIDKESGIAVFEAGVLGPYLDEQLSHHGFMFGHDPDSYAFSTLGGWIAARGSGAMSNKYGDIENMVLAMRLATPIGVLETPVTSRPCGSDLNGIIIGSEGAFGIVTEATVKIEPIPSVRHYEGWLFPSFECAFSAFHTCTRKGIHPCAMRLYDEDDTRLSFAASTENGMLPRLVSRGMKKFLEVVKGWNLRKLSLVIVGFEGSKGQTDFQRKELTRVFKEYDAVCVGSKAGDSWQEKKYDLPHMRDFALAFSYWADVFETSVLYSEAIPCWRAVKEEFENVMRENGKPGWMGCHTAHQYRYGCCLYFTFIGVQTDENDMKIFLQIKKRAVEAMMKHTGNLSHHHGIGYEHVPWMERYNGKVGLDILMKLKQSIDPKNICNPGKLLPSPKQEGESPEAWEGRRNREMMFDKMGIPGALTAHL